VSWKRDTRDRRRTSSPSPSTATPRWARSTAVTGELHALDPADGHIQQRAQLGPVPHFATPTLSGGRVFVGTLDGVTALSGA